MIIRHFILFLIFGCVGAAGAEGELPGYPYAPNPADYECAEGAQRHFNKNVEEKEKYTALYHLCIHKSFSSSAKNTLRQAFQYFVAVPYYQDFFDCALKELGDSETDQRIFQMGPFHQVFLRPALSARHISGPGHSASKVYISALEGAERFAEGYRNLFSNPKLVSEGAPWLQFISIAASKKWAGSTETLVGQDIKFWAGMLGIAFFKNMKISDEAPVGKLSTAHALGKCIRWTGKIPEEHQFKRGGGQ